MLVAITDGGKRKDKGVWSFLITEAAPLSILGDYEGAASAPLLHVEYGLIPDLVHSGQAEVHAAARAINFAVRNNVSDLTVISDNMYVVHGVRRPHRMLKNAAPILYADWRGIVVARLNMDIETIHVKGHSKHTWNSFADWICNKALDGEDRQITRGWNLFNSSIVWRKSLIKVHR